MGGKDLEIRSSRPVLVMIANLSTAWATESSVGLAGEAKRYSKEASDKWVSNILLNEYQAIEAGASKCMDC